MIVYEEGKIIAISKNLLNILNIDLKEISEIINQIELEIAVLHKDTIKIKDISFKINKENMIALKNLDIFKLEKEETLNPLEGLSTLKIPAEEEKKEEK